MRKLLPTTLIVASCALGLGLAAASLATASYAPTTAHEEFSHSENIVALPTPVIGEHLFSVENNRTACMNRDLVIDIFFADQDDFGGRTVKIVDNQDQAFADYWRAQTGVAEVEISGIIGHVYLDNASAEWTVDLVEFDVAGCAMSRTLVPADVWNDLLRNSAAA